MASYSSILHTETVDVAVSYDWRVPSSGVLNRPGAIVFTRI